MAGKGDEVIEVGEGGVSVGAFLRLRIVKVLRVWSQSRRGQDRRSLGA